MSRKLSRRDLARRARRLERVAYGFLCAVSVAGAAGVLTVWASFAFA